MMAIFQTRLGKILIWQKFLERESPTLIMWSGEVTYQIKNISPLLQCPWSPNLSGWWHTAKKSHSEIHMTPQWGGIERSRHKLNQFCLHLQKTYEPELGKMLTYRERLPLLNPYDPLIKNFKNLYLHFQGVDFGKEVNHANA